MRYTRSFMTSMRGLCLCFRIIRTLIAKEIAFNHSRALVSRVPIELGVVCMSKKRFAQRQRFAVTGIGLLLLLLACEMAKEGAPQAAKPSPTPRPSQLPPGDLVRIESLMNIEVTSVSKKERPVWRTVLNVPRGIMRCGFFEIHPFIVS
jgi:hypothetical protein